jgi:hypothetical protein
MSYEGLYCFQPDLQQNPGEETVTGKKGENGIRGWWRGEEIFPGLPGKHGFYDRYHNSFYQGLYRLP